uniref:Uncharacterized protein n=1 Tax=Fagus sylvatica TaxID=28930 RepID=A0A2N9HJT8_FAGSY
MKPWVEEGNRPLKFLHCFLLGEGRRNLPSKQLQGTGENLETSSLSANGASYPFLSAVGILGMHHWPVALRRRVGKKMSHGLTPGTNDRCQDFSAQLFCTADATAESENGSTADSRRANARQGKETRKRAAESRKWKEHNQRQKGAWRQYEESKRRPAYDGSYSLCTADNSQTTADS